MSYVLNRLLYYNNVFNVLILEQGFRWYQTEIRTAREYYVPNYIIKSQVSERGRHFFDYNIL